MTEINEIYLAIGRGLVAAQESQLFGKPCFKVNGKAFICLFENEMVFKLTGEFHSEALSYDGSKLFDPSAKNRPMKEWVQVPKEYQDRWTLYAAEAMKYVSGK